MNVSSRTEYYGGQRWLPIDSAPFSVIPETGDKWLGECLLRVRGVTVQGRCSGGMWLRRDHDDPTAWDEILTPPSHWMPLLPKPEAA